MSTFFKGDRDNKSSKAEPAGSARRMDDDVSTVGSGMQINGNVVCTGSLQVHGRIVGDIHASRLTICDGARVEGKIVAPETVIEGHFKGTVNGNDVKLQSTAIVEGEIYHKTLAVEQNAQFEGVSRRIEKPVEAPASETVASAPDLAPASASEPVAS